MRGFTRVCLEIAGVLVITSVTGLAGAGALPLAGLFATLAGLTAVIEREQRVAELGESEEDLRAQPSALALVDPPLRTVAFRLPNVGQASTVSLVGDFNEWSRTAHPMRLIGDAWIASVVLRRGRTYRYRYLLDGDRWENDWTADDYAANEFGGEDSVLDLSP